MQYVRKRIIAIVLGTIAVVLSLLWMRNMVSSSNLIPAIIFSFGLIVVLESINHILLNLANRTITKDASDR